MRAELKKSGSVKKLRCECLWGGGRGSITQESPEIAFPCRTVQNPRLPFQLSTGPPSVKTNAYLALPGSVVLSLSPSITSQKKDKLAREKKNKKNPAHLTGSLQLLTKGKGGEANERKPWLSLFSQSVGRFFSPATSGRAVRWCIVFFPRARGAVEIPGPVWSRACSSLSLYLRDPAIRHGIRYRSHALSHSTITGYNTTNHNQNKLCHTFHLHSGWGVIISWIISTFPCRQRYVYR